MVVISRRALRGVILALVAAVSILVGALVPASASAATTYAIAGTVTSSATGNAALSGAAVTVEYQDGDGQVVSTATTNASGHYSAAVPSSGNYQVVVSDPGYVSNSDQVTAADGTTTADLALDPAAFSGTVTDHPSGNDASGVDVELYDSTTNSIEDVSGTDQNGYFAFSQDDLTAGDSYIIEYAGFGEASYAEAYYKSGSSTGATAQSSATPLLIATQGLNAALTPTAGEISGTVTDASGPVAGAQIELANQDQGLEFFSPITTSSTGTYVIGGLSSGSDVVEAIPPAVSSDVTTYAPNSGDPYTATQIAVTSPNATTSQNITLLGGGTVAGTVTNPSGVGISGINVGIDDATGDTIKTVNTGADGSYSVSGVPAGTYYVNLDATASDITNSTTYASQWYGAQSGAASADEESSAAAVTVTAASTTTVNQKLALGGAISGNVNEAGSGKTLSAVVIAETPDGSIAGVGEAQNGSYLIPGLTAGHYDLQFIPSSYTQNNATVQDATAWWAGAGSLAESRQTATAVTVTAGATPATANAQLPVAGNIEGTITTNGKPVSGADVELLDSAGNVITGPFNESVAGFSSQDGVYEISGLLPGSYKVQFSTPQGADLAFQYYKNAATPAAATSVTVAANQTTKTVDAALTAGGSITGTVTDATTKAGLSGIEVDLLDSTGAPLLSTTTRDDGSYTLPGLSTGSYYVEFTPDGAYANHYQTQYYGNKQVLAGSTAVTVAEGSVTPNINASMAPAITSQPISTQTTTQTVSTSSPTPTLKGSVTISGTPKVGNALTADPVGFVTGASYSYQWFANGRTIPGAANARYVPTGRVYRDRVTVQVTAAKSGYDWATVTSAASSAVKIGTLKAGVAKITGHARIGATLKATVGRWSAGTRFSYQWFAGRRPIARATRSTLKLGAAEANETIAVKVTAALAGYRTTTKTAVLSTKVRR